MWVTVNPNDRIRVGKGAFALFFLALFIGTQGKGKRLKLQYKSEYEYEKNLRVHLLEENIAGVQPKLFFFPCFLFHTCIRVFISHLLCE